jgi:hypothetical protein
MIAMRKEEHKMISEFDWCDCQTVTQAQKKEVEASIRRTLQDWSDDKLKPCHHGNVKVKLNVCGPLFSQVVGHISCSCGRPFCKFITNDDASSGTFEIIDK